MQGLMDDALADLDGWGGVMRGDFVTIAMQATLASLGLP